MTAKEFLRSIRNLDRQINSKLAMIEGLNESILKVTSVISDMPRGGGPKDPADIIIKKVMLEGEINQDIDRLIDLKAEAVRCIKAIDNPEYIVLLEKRYLQSLSWEQVAVDMHFNMSWIHKLHGMALQEVEKRRE